VDRDREAALTAHTTTVAGVDDNQPAPPRGPTRLQVVLLAVACLFAGGAAMNWWHDRPPGANDADVGFLDDMTVHHEQAIDMSLTYLRYGNDPLLRHMADEIVLFQAGDLRTMQHMLAEWNEQPDDDVAMDWMDTPVPETAQPGMATRQELRELEAARGRDLDELFSRLMIDHHLGGVHMARAELELGENDDAQRFAGGVARTQLREIDEINFARNKLDIQPVEPNIP
jgi:uncharacterized protein (DUF305 family)